jgi:NAD(P)-dependent dehydrogenase (short-subunit alcohol dehydrogenase family)
MDLGLGGKVVVVTGAGAGIGLACAQAFAAEGAIIVGADLKPDELQSIQGAGKVIPVVMDLVAPDGPQRLIEQAVREFGTVDVLVNNIGGARMRNSFLDLDDNEWRWVLELNFMIMARSCRAVLPTMVKNGKGVIISIASDSGKQPDPFYLDYCVSKAAVLSLVKSLSIEFGPKGIRSNAVSPGPTRTPALVNGIAALAPTWGMTTEQAIGHFVKNVRRLPLGTLGEPEDVAAAVTFLASDRAKQVTGSTYCVDGGVMHSI